MKIRNQIVLAIETALHPGSVSIIKGAEQIDSWVGNEKISSSEDLLPGIENLLKKNRIKRKDINLVGVSLGPGSFTGVRVGLATAKGLALGIGCLCMGVSTLEVLAASAEKKGKVRSVIAGGRGEAFYQDFYFEDFYKSQKLTVAGVSEIEKLSLANSTSDLITIVLDGKLKQRNLVFNNLAEIKFQPLNLAKYVGLAALENLKSDAFEELIPQYNQAVEIGKSIKG